MSAAQKEREALVAAFDHARTLLRQYPLQFELVARAVNKEADRLEDEARAAGKLPKGAAPPMRRVSVEDVRMWWTFGLPGAEAGRVYKVKKARSTDPLDPLRGLLEPPRPPIFEEVRQAQADRERAGDEVVAEARRVARAQAAAAAQESARALRQHQAFLSRLTLAAQGVGPDGKKKAGTRSLEDLAADLVGSLADDLAKHSKEMHHEDKHRWIMRILAFKEADARLQAALAKAGAFLASSERTEALGTHGGSSDGAEEPKPQDDLDADGIRGLASGILAALDAEKRVDE